MPMQTQSKTFRTKPSNTAELLELLWQNLDLISFGVLLFQCFYPIAGKLTVTYKKKEERNIKIKLLCGSGSRYFFIVSTFYRKTIDLPVILYGCWRTDPNLWERKSTKKIGDKKKMGGVRFFRIEHSHETKYINHLRRINNFVRYLNQFSTWLFFCCKIYCFHVLDCYFV